MREEEDALPVSVRLTSEAGVFIVSEPRDSRSASAAGRTELEKKLTAAVLEWEWQNSYANGTGVLLPRIFSIGDLVAVSVTSVMLWHRGQIRSKIHHHTGTVWGVLLVDWGETVEVMPKDVVPLPAALRAHPFYAQHAVLGGIEPVSSVVDYASSKVELKHGRSKGYDEAAKFYIEEKIKTGTGFKMAVIGLDNDYRLHVRLFLKLHNNQSSYFCLNDRLCARKYAQVCDSSFHLVGEFDKSSFWESLPILPIQSTLEEPSNEFIVGFSEYVNKFETIMEKKTSPEYGEYEDTDGSLSSGPSDTEEQPVPHEAVPAANQESYTATFNKATCFTQAGSLPVGRGRSLIALQKHLEALRSVRKLSDSAPSTEIVEARAAHGSQNQEKTSPPGVLAVARSCLRRDGMEETSSIGRGSVRSALSALNGRKSDRDVPRIAASFSASSSEDFFASASSQNFDLKIESVQTCKDLTEDSNSFALDTGSHYTETGTSPRIPHLTELMKRVSVVSRSQAVTTPQEEERSAVSDESSRKPSVPSRPSSRLESFKRFSRSPLLSGNLNPAPEVPMNRKIQGAQSLARKWLMTRNKNQEPTVQVLPTAAPTTEKEMKHDGMEANRNFSPKDCVLRLKAVVEAKRQPQAEPEQPKAPTPSQTECSLEEELDEDFQDLLKLAMASKASASPSKPDRSIAPEGAPASYQESGDVKELLELVRPSVSEAKDERSESSSNSGQTEPQGLTTCSSASTQVAKPIKPNGAHSDALFVSAPMLKRSKIVNLTEDGRVLVRSSIPVKATHSLSDFPFDSLIHERLRRLYMLKPKVIQAYVWEAILSGLNVAYVAGPRSGKTLGYLVPIMSNLLDLSSYDGAPNGCSPLFIAICPTWEKAQTAHDYWCRIMKNTKEFQAEVLYDSTPRSIQESLTRICNRVAFLAATAPALAALLEEAKGIINFDRCFHLVLDSADELFDDHPDAMTKLIAFYRQSLKRLPAKADSGVFVPRQIIACSERWNKNIEWLTSSFMENPALFISSYMEAAFYGRMKLDVRRGTAEKMDAALLDIVEQKRLTRTIIFCRSADEVFKVEKMLSKLGVRPLLAHNQSVVADFDFVVSRWENAALGSAIMLCTDDVLGQLSIRDAQTLIHYFIPYHSKYDFSFRLSFAMEKFSSDTPDCERPESFLLITEEFQSSLLTVVRFMQRFDRNVPQSLIDEAILSFSSKEYRKKDQPLCLTLKAIGFCRDMNTCTHRHVIVEKFDRARVPRNGVVRIRITSVCDATRYYARILKYWDENRKLVDVSATHLLIAEQMRNLYQKDMVPVRSSDIAEGKLYARRYTEGLLQRVRVESILERDFTGLPVEVLVTSIDQGSVLVSFVQDLFEMTEELKAHPPEAIEVFLVGAKPLERNTTWSRYASDLMREKLMGKELEGNIVLALSSTLWLQPLHERTRPDGMKTSVVTMDVLREILNAKLGEKNPDHMMNLHHLCETGGFKLPDPTIGLAKKAGEDELEPSYAFLRMHEEAEVEVTAADSPGKFYLQLTKHKAVLQELEKDIAKELTKCKKMSYEEAHAGRLCLVEVEEQPGVWNRGYIQKRTATEEAWMYSVFLVDYGDTALVPLSSLRRLPTQFVTWLPFQSIACSLFGVQPQDEQQGWTTEAIEHFVALTRKDHNGPYSLRIKKFLKEPNPDAVTSGPRYRVKLVSGEGEDAVDLAQSLIAHSLAVPSSDDEEGYARMMEEKQKLEKEKRERQDAQLRSNPVAIEEEDDAKFYMSEDWADYVFQCLKPPGKEAAVPTAKTPPPKTYETERRETDKSTTLMDHAMPLKAASNRFPTTKWSQNKLNVFVNFCVAGITTYDLTISEDHLSFFADVGGMKYELRTYLYGSVIPDESSHSLSSSGVQAVLRKQAAVEANMWTRLVRSPHKQPWLSRDFTLWTADSDEDDLDDEEQTKTMFVDPKYAYEDVQDDTEDSDDSSDELPDEFVLRGSDED